MNERFELPAELTIYTALETRDSLLAWAKELSAKGVSPLKISARQVGSVDGAGLQLLAALNTMELQWQLVDTSQPFGAACRLMGLQSWLDSPYLSASETGVSA
ncbi:MAG: STAS domain-containing protein [Hylemonella sp.]|nr:STAS domain-containing protein [Hylemonella sp.]